MLAINLLWVSAQDKTGAFIYVKNLLDNLFSLDNTTTYLIIVRARDYHYFNATYSQPPRIQVAINDIRVNITRHPLRALVKFWYKLRHNERKIEQIIAAELTELAQRKNVKKMFFPTQVIYPRGLVGIEHYVTVLDLQHEYLPENFSAKELAHRRDNLDYICQTAHHLFAISEYTKKTLLEKYQLPENKITVTPLAPHETNAKAESIDLPSKYLFYPAALWSHKNHRLIIEVLNKLRLAHPDLHVVFSGLIKKVSIKKELDELVKKYDLVNQVHFLGLVSDEVLEYLYRQATLMIFPSLFEGFGMPILEAYRHNLPVVAARNSSITEVAGDATLLCETNNVQEFTEAIKTLLENNELRKSLIPKMQSRLAFFSWQKTAKLTLQQLTQ